MRSERMLLAAVFVAGMTTLGVELSASRLLGNVFGTSNLVWANIIGLILVYLSAGYFIGGRWADRSPHFATFYQVLSWGAFTSGLVPVAARQVLRQAALAVEQLDAAVMLGSFLSVLVLFAIPVTLLGCISPFAIRLAITDASDAGKVSGRIYALSTLGSILGTFLPVLWLIPTYGTSMTFLILSLSLLVVVLIGQALRDRKAALRMLWMPAVLLLVAWFGLRGPIKRTEGQVYETESAYNYIQVVEKEGTRYLLLNEGQGVHSVYNPDRLGTYGTWDYFLAAPFFNPAPVDGAEIERIGIVGLAAGTIAKEYTEIFGPIAIDGWEIDPVIIEVGRQYFAMTEPNLNAIASDGRWGLEHSPHDYDLIMVDAYRPPYIPWHLTTIEFFQTVHDRLSEDGVLSINVWKTPQDRRLVDAMATTIGEVFPSVYVVDVAYTFNTIIYATVQSTESDNLGQNFLALSSTGEAHPLLLDVLALAISNIQPTPTRSTVFTDDLAPVEWIANSIALGFLFQGGLAGLPPVQR